MAHQKRVIDFALFFYALFNSPIISWRFILPGQTGTPQDKPGHRRTNRDTHCRLSKYSIFSRYLWMGIIP